MRLPRLRITLRRLSVVVAALAMIVACAVGWFRDPLEIAPYPLRSNVDHEIFDIVLADLIGNKEFSPATVSRVKKSRIVLVNESTRSFKDLQSLHYQSEVKEMITPDLWRDFEVRNPPRKRYSLAGYYPSNPKILVRDRSVIDEDFENFRFGDDFPDAAGYVSPSLPGYSRDGQTALFGFSFGPTPHGAIGCYLLKKAKGRWEIVGRYIGYFT